MEGMNWSISATGAPVDCVFASDFARRPVCLARRRSSTSSASPSGPPVECVGDACEGLSQGGQVPVVHPTGIKCGSELGQRRGPCRTLGDGGDGHFLHNGDEPVYLDYPVDDLDGGLS